MKSGLNFTSGRIIYGTTRPAEATLADWRADCERRRGQFNECGSPCGRGASACIAVCAYTCENISQN